MQVPQQSERLVALAFYRVFRDGEELVRSFSHSGNHENRLTLQARAHNGGDALNGCGGLDRRAAKFHNDHPFRSPSEYKSSPFRTAAPAAPRMVLCPHARNL